MQQKTQTAQYWQELTIENSDLTFLDYLFLEQETPQSTDELTLAIIQQRCKVEETFIRKELDRGTIYKPQDAYAVGDQLVFPALDFVAGAIVGTRPGHNPEYGDFTVIQVELEPDAQPREFASQLASPHTLNFEGGKEALLHPEGFLSAEELFELYGPIVKPKLLEKLNESETMVQFDGLWFSKAMLADIHVGHLNVAEAVIDINDQPAATRELLKELDLPAEISPSLQVFSLNHALAQDERFIDVGSTDNILWYLARLIPQEVMHPPRRLNYSPISYDRSVLNEELFQLEREINDEASELIASPDADKVKSTTIVLTYPHRRVGTLPLTAKTRFFFPPGTTQRTAITLVDGHSDTEMPAWINHSHNYVYGLEKWYKDNKIPVGAFIQLERTKDPFKVVVSFKPRRMRREWVRVAEANEDRVNFSVRKMPISCEYDETMLVWAEDLDEIDALWIKAEESNKTLREIIENVFLELAKLNPQGTVHVKSIYSAVNIVRRCPPGPIFAELLNHPAFASVGDAHWKYIE